MVSKIPLCALLSVLLAACGPSYPPPQGFVDSCYGGDAKKYLDGAIPVVTIKLGVSEDTWLDLVADLKSFAAKRDLYFFDTSKNIDDVRVLGLSICSSSGVNIVINEQHWKAGPLKNKYDPNHVWVRFYTYKGYHWQSLGRDLTEELKDWGSPEGVQ